MEQDFLIIKELHHSLTLGIDFLNQDKCIVDFQHNLVKFPLIDVSVVMLQDSKLGNVWCVKPQVIKANTETIINVRVSKGHKNETLLLDPSDNLQGTNIIGARCLVTTKNNKTVMTLANPTNEDIYLSKSGVLANIHVVDSKSIFCLGDECSDETTSTSDILKMYIVNSDYNKKVPDFSDNIKFEINNDNLSKEQNSKLKNLLMNNKDVFSTSLQNIGKTGICKHTIETYPDAVPD